MSKREAPDLTSFDIPRAKKGGAAPAAAAPSDEVSRPPLPPAAAPPAAAGAPPAPSPELVVDEGAVGEPRSAVTTRLTLRTQERLRLLAFKSRRTKQALVDEALEAYLASKGV